MFSWPRHPPKPDTSFGRAQDERELMDEIRLLAVSEAYGAKDGFQRMQEMAGQSRLEVIETYFAANPEIKRFAERNIDAGACCSAVFELRERKERLRQWRAEQRGRLLPPTEPDPALDWLRQAARGSGRGTMP